MPDDIQKIIETLTALEKEANPAPWCKDYCYSAIRHVQRNCDIECGTHEGGDEICEGFGRYDGPFIAAMRNALPQLLEYASKAKAEGVAEGIRIAAYLKWKKEKETTHD